MTAAQWAKRFEKNGAPLEENLRDFVREVGASPKPEAIEKHRGKFREVCSLYPRLAPSMFDSLMQGYGPI